MLGASLLDYGGHDFCCDGREQDAVAEVAGGDIVSGRSRLSKDGKGIGRAGAQPCPAFQDLRVAKFWHQGQSGIVQALDRISVGAFVEARLLDRGADEQASIAARDEISFWRSHNVLKQISRRHGQAYDLALHGASREGVRRDLP